MAQRVGPDPFPRRNRAKFLSAFHEREGVPDINKLKDIMVRVSGIMGDDDSEVQGETIRI